MVVLKWFIFATTILCTIADPFGVYKECSKDPISFTHESLVDLTDIQLVRSVTVTLDATNIEPKDIRVLGGRLNPICNPNLHYYIPCSASPANKGIMRLQCWGKIFRYIVVSATHPILKVETDNNDAPPLVDINEKAALDDYMREKEKWVDEISVDVDTIVTYSWPGVLQLFGDRVFPIAQSGPKVFIAGAEIEAGRVVVVNGEDFLSNIAANAKLFDNLAKWASRGSKDTIIDAKNVSSSSIENIMPGDLMIWNAMDTIGLFQTKQLTSLVRQGSSLIVFFNSWYYNRDISSLENSEIETFLKECGIMPVNDYIFIKQKMEVTLNWAAIRSYKSPLLHLQLMINNVGEFIKGMKNWLELAPTITGLYQKEFKQLYQNYLPILENAIGCKLNPTSNPDQMELLKHFSTLFESVQFQNSDFKAPAVAIYPGDMHETTPLVSATVQFTCDAAWEAIPTGYYLPAGKTLTATQITDANTPFKSWRVWINYNMFDTTNHNSFYKLPIGYSGSNTWSKTTVKLYNGLGGMIFIQCGNKGDKLRARFDGVVRTPLFDIRDQQSVAEWPQRLQSPGLWASVAADGVIFIAPKYAFTSNSSELVRSMQLYDVCVKEQLYMTGEDPTKKRREMIAADEQILAGWMHSGYPIGVFMEVVQPSSPDFLFNATKMAKDGMWGIFHELGHNRQDSLWTWKDVVEVSNNLLSALCDERVAGRKAWSNKDSWLEFKNWQITKVKPYLEQDPLKPETKWQDDVWVALSIYTQIKDMFGWELYRQVFRHYRDLPEAEKEKLRQSDGSHIADYWFTRLSLTSGYNLHPVTLFWRAPFTQQAIDKVKHLPTILPDDFMTQTVPEVTNRILSQFPNIVRTAVPIKEVVGPLTIPTNQIQGVKQVFFENEEKTGQIASEQAPCWSRVKV